MGYCLTHNQNYDERHGGFCYQCRDAANIKIVSTTSTNPSTPCSSIESSDVPCGSCSIEINIERCFSCKYKGEQVYNHFVNRFTAIWCLHFCCVGKVGVTGRMSSKDCNFYEYAPQNTKE